MCDCCEELKIQIDQLHVSWHRRCSEIEEKLARLDDAAREAVHRVRGLVSDERVLSEMGKLEEMLDGG